MKLTRADKILIAVLLLANVFFLVRMGPGFDRGDWVVIEVAQKEIKRLPLNTDQITRVKGPLGITEVEIRDGKARVLRSPCSNKVCIKSGYIKYADRVAACIPNRVVVRIVGNRHRGVDAVVG